MKLFLLILAMTGCACLQAQPTGENWELVRQRNGIQGFTRVVEGEPLREYKVVTTVAVPFDTVVRYMREGALFALWVGKAQRNYRLLETRPDGSVLFYGVIPARSTQIPVSGTSCVSAANGNAKYAGNRDSRQKFNALWYARPVGEDKVEISYRGSADPAGKLPKRFANKVMADNPFATVRALKKVLERTQSGS